MKMIYKSKVRIHRYIIITVIKTIIYILFVRYIGQKNNNNNDK